MERFWQGAALVLLTVIIGAALGKQRDDIGSLLVLTVCCMIVGIAISYITPVIGFIQQLRTLAQLDDQMLEILLKIVGIGMVGEIASMICVDSGNSALGRSLQLLSTAVILWMSLPMLQKLLDLLQDILGEA
ncbi:MAG: hypothetical protein IJW45_06235 [Oscillospiraceae bacterium]|nr:hypothetical protein [Oscillospiraceae bacterium]